LKLFDLDKIIDTFTGFLETKIELMKLDAKDEVSALITKAIVFLVILVLAFLAILFMSLAVSAVLNSYFDSGYLGYLIVGIIYIVLAGVIFVNRVSLLERIRSQANVQEPKEDL